MATKPLTAAHRVASLAYYIQRHISALAARDEARSHPEGAASAAAERAALEAVVAAEERIAALRRVDA